MTTKYTYKYYFKYLKVESATQKKAQTIFHILLGDHLFIVHNRLHLFTLRVGRLVRGISFYLCQGPLLHLKFQLLRAST